MATTSPPIVLVSPLNWGLGHATRLIPIVHYCIDHGATVILGGSGDSLSLLSNEFPDLQTEALPAFNLRYSPMGNQFYKLLVQLPQMLRLFIQDKKCARRLAKEQKIDVIISDNRYGLYNRKCHGILITHQLSPALPGMFAFLEYMLYRFLRRFISRFDECWVPDQDDRSLNFSGRLSHKYKLPVNARFTGLLSRFIQQGLSTGNSGMRESQAEATEQLSAIHYDLTVILSGPEPQKTLLYEVLIHQLRQKPELKSIIISGSPGENKTQQNGQIRIVSHLPTPAILRILSRSRIIICRSGYSSIMDLVALGRSAILIPTPGQTEQQYLGQWLSKKGLFLVKKQNGFDLEASIREFLDNFDKPLDPGFPVSVNKITIPFF